jgi:hypothetical protein
VNGLTEDEDIWRETKLRGTPTNVRMSQSLNTDDYKLKELITKSSPAGAAFSDRALEPLAGYKTSFWIIKR